MAQVRTEGDLLCVQLVTGPSHAWLGVKFGDACEEPMVVKRPPRGNCNHGEIDQRQLVETITSVVESQCLHVERIEYVANDSPDYFLYAYCAHLLAQHAKQKQE
ncbi:hypothetical protein [Calycomorphotria hydatis]|nr:hypothetical protein [Calycomorphotria hydatis]